LPKRKALEDLGKAPSGPFLVSRNGKTEKTERHTKVPKRRINEAKGVDALRQLGGGPGGRNPLSSV